VSGRLVSAAAAALLGALASVVFLAGAYLLSPALRLDFAVDPPRLVTGMHPGERDEASGLTFAWTGRDVAIRLPGLDRRVPWSLELRLRGGRPHQPDNPVVVVSVDGAPLLEHPSQTDFTTVRVTVPPRPARPRGALITLRSSANGEGALLLRPEAAVRWLPLSAGGCVFLDACAAERSLAEAAQAAVCAEPACNFAELFANLLSAGAIAGFADDVDAKMDS
jgi:hypothetical protein